jgi:hypothetical protein
MVVADMILAGISDDTVIWFPSDFGVLVSRDNLEAHLNNLRNQTAWAKG